MLGFPWSGRGSRWGVWQVGFIDGAFTCLIVGPSEPPPDSHQSIIGWLRLNVPSDVQSVQRDKWGGLFFLSLFEAFNTTRSAVSQASTHQDHVSLPTKWRDEKLESSICWVRSCQCMCDESWKSSPSRPPPGRVKHTPENIKLTFPHQKKKKKTVQQSVKMTQMVLRRILFTAGFTSQTFTAPLLPRFCTQTPAFMTWQRFCKHVPSSDSPAHVFSAINTINNILQNASPGALRQLAAVHVH